VNRLIIECLGCGKHRTVAPAADRRADAGECGRCGYVGWAPARTMGRVLRRQLRRLPAELRGLRIAH
jgi:hypothetical protein